jgi:AraC family transcriptional regulator, regulatory protein of adaptative response / methylated-DNA-[protein]-cysteine methyltransferase
MTLMMEPIEQRANIREEDAQMAFVQAACRVIDARLDAPPTLAELSQAVSVSPHHLQRTFTRLLGISPRQYAEARRLERVKAGLRQESSVTAAIYEAGFGSSSRLYERAPTQLGMTPRDYRRGGLGLSIDFVTARCSLGRLLVAATERGLCAVRLGDSDEQLADELRREFPHAEIQLDEGRLMPWVQTIVEYLDGQRTRLDMPLDVRATAFQWQVWQALRDIPYGDTASYSEIARAIGKPGSARAVANACANNPVALAIPCHRVVHQDGDISGYRWGTERKRQILETEARQAAGDNA